MVQWVTFQIEFLLGDVSSTVPHSNDSRMVAHTHSRTHMCAKIPISWVYPSPINSGSGFRSLKKEVWLWFDWHHVTGYIQHIYKKYPHKSILIDILAEICTRYALCFSMAPSSLHDSMVAWWYHSLASLSSTAASPARPKIPTKQSQVSFVFMILLEFPQAPKNPKAFLVFHWKSLRFWIGPNTFLQTID